MEKRKTTIQDIAKTANVSKSTVSRVINNTTPVHENKRKAVLEAMEKLNFKPNIFARGLAGGQSMTIGVITQNIGSPFYDHVTQGVIDGLHDSEYSPIIADGQWTREVESNAIDTMLGRQVDGLVIVGGTLSAEEIEEIREQIPVIVVAREIEGCNNCFFTDNTKAAFEATQHLIELGHTKIGHITGIPTHQDAIRRLNGFQKAIREAGITLDENLIFKGNFSGQSGLDAIEFWRSQGTEFTAIFAANDEMAFGARLGLYRHGVRVPREVSIIGFDDQPNSAFMTPPLTTIKQPALELGVAASKAVLSFIQEQEFSAPDLTATLVIRESAGSPAG